MNELALFNNLFDDFGFDGYSLPSYNSRRGFFAPKVDVKENDKEYTMEMDLPGKTQKDINVELDKNVLTISSHKEETKETSDKNEKSKDKWLLRERTYSSFSRSFTLPEDVDSEKLSAVVKDGVLKVVMPRKEAPLPKKITVNVA